MRLTCCNDFMRYRGTTKDNYSNIETFKCIHCNKIIKVKRHICGEIEIILI
mgnify:CR=1 FL=1